VNNSDKKFFSTQFSTYEIVRTNDGYPTLFSKHFDELCHSNIGSYEETLFNYVEALEIIKILKSQRETTIFEMGFGAGIGLLVTLDEYFKHKVDSQLIYHSVEIDEGLIFWSLENVFLTRPNYEWMNHYRIVEENGFKVFKIDYQQIQIIIHIGDAREITHHLLKKMVGSVDAFYQDPFSPSKNPLLWTVEWFKDLYGLGSLNAVLSTYSASTLIRKSLLLAGWQFGNYLGYGTKRGMTRAWKNGKSMDEVLKGKVDRSPLIPLRDQNLLHQE